MSDRIYNVLFLCTGNSARSILGEVLLNHIGKGRFRAYSAGSRPKGEVNPGTIAVLKAEGLPTQGLRSKSWDEFATPEAPQMDFVFTVCDDAAGETCPFWPGMPVTAHWGIEDPARVDGSPIEIETAFVHALMYMRNRIEAFTSLPLSSLDRMTTQARVRAIGSLPGGASPKVA